MPRFPVLYYPTFEPPAHWLRSYLLFYDQVRTIVPKDVNFSPSPDVSKVIDLIPDSFSIVAPDKEDLFVDDINLTRLEKAFKEIAADSGQSNREVTMEFDNGQVCVMNHVFQHYSKTIPRVKELLEEYGLIIPGLGDLYGKPGEFLVVREAASNLILSHIADKLGSRTGVNTITDQQVDFGFIACNGLRVSGNENATSKLASAIIQMEVPDDVLMVEPKRYKDIRESFSQIREPFQKSLTELSQLHRLNAIQDNAVLDQRVLEIATEFDAEIAKLKNSEFGRKLNHWVPIGVGCALSVIAQSFDQPIISATTTTVSIALQIYKGIATQDAIPNAPRHIQRLIGKMQEDIRSASPFTVFA
jgi:hypothetical protein